MVKTTLKSVFLIRGFFTFLVLVKRVIIVGNVNKIIKVLISLVWVFFNVLDLIIKIIIITRCCGTLKIIQNRKVLINFT